MKILRSLQNIINILISSINTYFTTGTTRTSRSISVLFDKKVFSVGFIGTPLNAWLRGKMKQISLSQNDKPTERREPSHLHQQFTNKKMNHTSVGMLPVPLTQLQTKIWDFPRAYPIARPGSREHKNVPYFRLKQLRITYA